MKPITHIAFSSLFCAVLATVANIALKPLHFLIIAAASLIPNIDHSPRLERIFGRRTITHSILGFVVFAVAALPFAIFKASSLYFIVLVSIAGHILIDCVNKEGVCLFYPGLARAVLPKNEKYRIARGSKTENMFSCVSLGLLLLICPINQAGLRPALHYLLQTQEAAITDYLSFSGAGHRVIVDFEGIKDVSQERIRGKWEVIDRVSRNSLIVKDGSGKLYTIGNDNHDNIRPIRIRAIKGNEQKQHVRRFELHNESLEKLFSVIPRDGESYISGYVTVDDAIAAVPSDINSYNTVKISAHKVELSYATMHDLVRAGLQDVFAQEGVIIVRTIISPGSPVSSEETALPPDRKIISVSVKGIKDATDILIKEGDSVKKGQALVVLHEKRDVKLIEAKKAVARLATAKAELYALKVKIADELKEKEREDAIMGIRRTLERLKQEHRQNIRKAYFGTYSDHLSLIKLNESIRSFETTSPCNGKVISIAIDGPNAKIRITENAEQH